MAWKLDIAIWTYLCAKFQKSFQNQAHSTYITHMGTQSLHTKNGGPRFNPSGPQGGQSFGLIVLEAENPRSLKVANMGIYGLLLTS